MHHSLTLNLNELNLYCHPLIEVTLVIEQAKKQPTRGSLQILNLLFGQPITGNFLLPKAIRPLGLLYVPSQWERTLQCNIISNWPGTYTDWSLPVSALVSRIPNWNIAWQTIHQVDSPHRKPRMWKSFLLLLSKWELLAQPEKKFLLK